MTAEADVEALLADSARALFARHCEVRAVAGLAPGAWSAPLWSVAEAAELPLVAVSEAAGGSGGTAAHWAVVLRAAGRACAPIPLAETGLAGWLLDAVGAEVPRGPLTFAQASPGSASDGVLARVPYARQATSVVVLLAGAEASEVALLARDRYEVEEVENLAGEPRDTIRFEASGLDRRGVVATGLGDGLRLRHAFARSVQMAGVLDAVMEQTLEHCRDRMQFGTSLTRLPVVRERLVLLAEEVAAAGAAADCAIDGVVAESELAVGAAKVRVGEAAGAGARLAHQLHGAMGMTREHPLHAHTRRLWAWREEGGSERWWSERIGRSLAARGAQALWPALTVAGAPDEA